MRQPGRGSVNFPGQYKLQILDAIEGIDLARIGQAIEIFKSARTYGRRIFVCGAGQSDALAAQILCDLVRRASFNRSSRFRILALSDELPKVEPENTARARVFVEQLKTFAEPEDVVVGICAFGDSPSIVNAVEYASWIGCRTIGITGCDGGRLAELSELSIPVPVSHLGSIEDAHMIICHMIGYYFLECESA